MRRVHLNILCHSNRWLYEMCIIDVFSVWNRFTWETSGIKIMNYTQYCNSPCTISHKLNYFNEQIWLTSLYTPANDEMLFFFRESEIVPKVLPTLSCTVRWLTKSGSGYLPPSFSGNPITTRQGIIPADSGHPLWRPSRRHTRSRGQRKWLTDLQFI